MSSKSKSKNEGLIHKIRDLELKQLNIPDHYDILKDIGSGDYGKVLLAVHRKSNTQVNYIAFE